MLATCRISCPLRTESVNLILEISLNYLDFLYNLFDTYIRTDMLATCRIPCPLRTAIVKINFCRLVLLIYARKCWPHAVSHVRFASQVNMLFIPI